MLEKPDLQDEKIIACLQAEYGLLVAQITFLPLGADVNTAVYRVVADPEFIVCHSDLHAGNFLIGASGALYIVDWDDPIRAPKERDLMFVGGGFFSEAHTVQEETLFYQTYGQTQIDPIALAYYRYERIIVDIALYCEQIFLTHEGREDREQAFRYLTSNFLPNSVLAIAYQSDKTLSDR
jgi:spectinomycin phosphotransferase